MLHDDEWKFYELNSQLELMHEIIKKIESQLKDSLDLQYLTAESALKIMHNNFLVMANQLLHSKHKIMKQMFERMEQEKKDKLNDN